jgi:hypothetical protein
LYIARVFSKRRATHCDHGTTDCDSRRWGIRAALAHRPRVQIRRPRATADLHLFLSNCFCSTIACSWTATRYSPISTRRTDPVQKNATVFAAAFKKAA